MRLLETHVADCDTCCQELRQVPHDDLVERLRSSTPVPALVTPLSTSVEGHELDALSNHPRYQIVREIGKGGMGVVYLAQHRVMGRDVALKVINRRLLNNPNAIERFRQEAQAAARLSHRNIVTAYDAEQAGDLHFLVMEYVDGTDLATILNRRGRLSVLHACNYIMQAAQGLQHAHEQGMVHRDIKPQNLMRTQKGTIKILDFGLARLANPAETEFNPTGLTAEGMTLGTPDYIAPEQARDARRADIRSDIYSLGCTLYQLLTGSVPFPEGTAMERMISHVNDDPVPISNLRSDVPGPLIEIIGRMMAKDPVARFQTPAEVAAKLRTFGIQGTVQADDLAGNASLAAPVQTSDTRVDTGHADGSDKSWIFADAGSKPTSHSTTDTGKSWVGRFGLPFAVAAIVVVGLMVVISNGTRPASKSLPSAAGNGRTQAATADGWIDLIPQPDLATLDAVGNWQQQGSELNVGATEAARMAIPYALPEEYDFEVQFTRHTGRHSIALIFSAGSGQATFEIDAWGDHLTGLQLIDGQDLRIRRQVHIQPVTNGRRYVARVEVRHDSVTAFVDNVQVDIYRGDGSNLKVLPLWQLPAERPLGVGAYNARTTFHRIRIRVRN